MAEVAVSSFASVVLGKLDELLTEKVLLLIGVEHELEKLKHSMSYIQAIISDAEKQYHTSSTAKIWLRDLEDFLFEMDDLLDEIDIEKTIQQKIKGDLPKKVRKFFSGSNFLLHRYSFAHQVRGLSKKLDAIRSNGRDFKSNPYQAGAISISSESRETCSKLPSWDTLGRDEDKKEIISLVSSSPDCENLTVIPIVGQGGLGKTTLAQLIYEDGIINSFDHKVWVFVSKRFSLAKILGQVIRSTSRDMTNMDHLSLEDLRLKVHDALLGKKYFMILDDVWNENPIELRQLRDLLNVGAKGSCILVTTRSAQVASHISTITNKYYRLQGLPKDSGLLLFKRLAFGVGDKDEVRNRERSVFDEMAQHIVNKSGGIPLILVILGNLLAGNRDENEWKHMVQTLENGHEDVLAILKLSYDQLPSFLKPCFRITSIFRREKNYIYVEYLMFVWIALGFISSNDHGQSLEDTAIRYVKELWSKCLLYDAVYTCGDLLYLVKMHDCLKGLARSIGSKEMAVVNCEDKGIAKSIKYIVFEDDSSPEIVPKRIYTASKARLFKLQTTKQVQKSFLEDIIIRFKWLRVLDLSGNDFEELPSSIGSMKHLRMLNLAGNRRIKLLPKSICNLLNLQSLLFNNCIQLQHVPKGIGRLDRLSKVLEFDNSTRLSTRKTRKPHCTSKPVAPTLSKTGLSSKDLENPFQSRGIMYRPLSTAQLGVRSIHRSLTGYDQAGHSPRRLDSKLCGFSEGFYEQFSCKFKAPNYHRQ